jgi:hypothetical protein
VADVPSTLSLTPPQEIKKKLNTYKGEQEAAIKGGKGVKSGSMRK